MVYANGPFQLLLGGDDPPSKIEFILTPPFSMAFSDLASP